MTDKRQFAGFERQAHPTQNPAIQEVSALDALLAAETVLALMAVGVALAAVLTLAPGSGEASLVDFGLALLLIQWVIALSLGTAHLFRRHLRALGTGRLALVLGAVLLGITVASATVGWAALGHPADLQDLRDFLLRCAAISIAVAGAGAALIGNTLRWQQSRLRLQKAELEGLQARVRPHFLFNALNTATALLPQQPLEAERVLMGLADLFRSALSDAHCHSLADEILLTRRYLEIESLRFSARLQVDWQMDDPLPAVAVPPLCLQALAENAIHHGIEPNREGGWIRIEVVTHPDKTLVEISNSLPAEGSPASRAAGTRLGLDGNRQRLAALLGPSAGIDTLQSATCHTARLHLPTQATTR